MAYAFTEHGVVMLSSVLNSDGAIEMSNLVANAFVHMRELIASTEDTPQMSKNWRKQIAWHKGGYVVLSG